ncbi:tryptophan--tRNA ligase [Candidatus Desantisbacteria bacterium CG2_30_40_21]|uniref:Tryptophan--tRNA ligase n=5 Tax=unclassified Candidatus Desantisiibacteriota TaxID=3106372 RepID=A0A2M7JAC9_9BACT|nr:MAG: tryptophan--tRNA ligase [Candidatus Desantisbacteria bacterium CG2_30_40_21]PIP42096.1 MAG: tryptophan--tRNA ligase [Candidatus Desantisbacteria bacterium CG23_combo_of_CG06-09_8_20_14_all_40_23]PIX16357.1 MAG: tryptophan--tRNA ligase [Candidatus Desantisbacteria bacterium CG_4_8_14_3_um_filter_40_12]PIY20173.1 MAG: tryptophan--tRNA ligase [Candidatus Desantisbacteria bacterium CG_4_10_14_3_um_filter_40_18]PJB29374.1 MAG: tryptophan--tRNA ligase [Candidatus Desantisbacteria bacterium CG
MERVLSGMRPTGKLHLGHLLGALKNWQQLQNEYECFYMVADWHALTTGYADTTAFKQNIMDMVVDWLSAGISPEKCTIFQQSHVKEHAELYLLLSIITPISWLERNPTYKEQIIQLANVDLSTHGFLGYPVLQAADILLYRATVVPIGVDQAPHIELTREIARRFNHFYGNIFPEPQEKLAQVPKLPGIDGRKMSKSYENCIYLADTMDIVAKKIQNMFTDPTRIHVSDPGHPEGCVVYAFHQAFNPQDEKIVKTECLEAKRGCRACKSNLADILKLIMAEIHERQIEFRSSPKIIEQILEQGNKRASKIASCTMNEIMKAVFGAGRE